MPTYKISDIDPVNQRNLKALENGGTVEFWEKGAVFAIGAGHKSELVQDLRTGSKGTIKITKGTLTNPGVLEVTGCGSRMQFQDMVKRITKKKVVFK